MLQTSRFRVLRLIELPMPMPRCSSASTGYRWSAAAAIAHSKGKGYKEDFVWKELEAAIELHEENKEEDK